MMRNYLPKWWLFGKKRQGNKPEKVVEISTPFTIN